MLSHIKQQHASKLRDKLKTNVTSNSSMYTPNDDHILENLAMFAIAETYSEQKDESFVGGGGSFDGGGASDSYESNKSTASDYSSSSSSSDYSSSYDSSSSSSSDSSSSSSSDW
jgi:hypothetical protein